MSMIGSFVAVTPAQLRGFLDDPDSVASFLCPDDDEPVNSIDIDKSWHGIHFLLTGETEGGQPPLSQVVLGGTEIGDDVGYGPARYLTPEQVKQVASALAALSRSQLASRFSAAAFEAADVYPQIWDEGQEALDYLLENYDVLVEFYRQASARGDAVLQYLN
jgi:hypothetical protein